MSLIVYQTGSFTGSTTVPLSWLGLPKGVGVASVAPALSGFSISNSQGAQKVQQLGLSLSATTSTDAIEVAITTQIESAGSDDAWLVQASATLFIQTDDACTTDVFTLSTANTSFASGAVTAALPADAIGLVPALGGFTATYDDATDHNLLTLEAWVAAQPGANDSATVTGLARIADDTDHSGVGNVTVALVPLVAETACTNAVPMAATVTGFPPFVDTGANTITLSVPFAPPPTFTITRFLWWGAVLQGFVLSNTTNGDHPVENISLWLGTPVLTAVADSTNWLATFTMDAVVNSTGNRFQFASVTAAIVAPAELSSSA